MMQHASKFVVTVAGLICLTFLSAGIAAQKTPAEEEAVPQFSPNKPKTQFLVVGKAKIADPTTPTPDLSPEAATSSGRIPGRSVGPHSGHVDRSVR